MKHSRFILGVVRFCTVILVGVLLLPLAPGRPKAAVQAWTRPLDPVIVTGSQLSSFYGVPLGDLFVYAYDGSTWTMVPFQFDEVNSQGSFVLPEDNVLDANDQLVFMAADLGGLATTYEWPDDADSKNHPRYEVHVTNPLHPAEEGWVYVYRSATLAPTFAPYVTWNGGSNSTIADTYIIGYAPANHLGLDSLQLNGYAGDVLDQSKFRLNGECLQEGYWEYFEVYEDSAEVIDSWSPPVIRGPVRVGGGSLDDYSWAYASMFEDRSTFAAGEEDPEDCEDIRYTLLRASEDWLNPAASGMAPMGYFDSNTPAGVMIDGLYDSIPSTPFSPWRQVSGAKGSVVQVMDIDAGAASVTNYYKDLNEEDPTDTGDKLSFGDAGFRVLNPADPVLMSTAHYVLHPFEVNVGATYRENFTNPLQAAATAQDYFEPAPNALSFTYSPKPSYSGEEITFTATADGFEPFTYDWLFGDDSSVASGNPVIHIFALGVTTPVTLTVTNDYGTAELVRQVLVFPCCTPPPTVNLPLIIGNAP